MPTLSETRFAYGEALAELGALDERVVVFDADLYNSTRTCVFRDQFPERFFDMGISEADMVSTAAGMAASGLIPFCNSFAMFITGMCYMPIRTQIAYPSLPVRLAGSSAGLTQGPDGASHQSLEDIALMRSLPNMTIISPADDVETRQATLALADLSGPAYLRLGRYPVPRVCSASFRFAVGRATRLTAGEEVVIFATGHLVSKSIDASLDLKRDGIDAGVVNISTIKPLDVNEIEAAAARARLLVTVEEHSIIGGLGSAVAECLAGSAHRPPLLRLGVCDCFGESGLADELLEKHGLQPPGIRTAILRRLASKE